MAVVCVTSTEKVFYRNQFLACGVSKFHSFLTTCLDDDSRTLFFFVDVSQPAVEISVAESLTEGCGDLWFPGDNGESCQQFLDIRPLTRRLMPQRIRYFR